MEPEDSPMHVNDKGDVSWALSFVVFLGMLLGAPVWGLFADRHGRKIAMLSSSFLVGAAGLLSALVVSITQFLVCRFFVGVGLAGAPCALSLFTECLPETRRQNSLIYFFGMFSVGSLLCAADAALFLLVFDSWRLLLVSCSIPSLLVVFWARDINESPLFLLKKGRVLEARQVTQQLSQGNDDTNDEEYVQMIQRAESISGGDVTTRESQSHLSEGDRLQPQLVLWLGILFLLMAVIYYSLVILSVAYIGGDKPIKESSQYVQLCVVNFAELPGLLGALYVIQKFDSRMSIIMMFAACAAFVSLMGVNQVMNIGDTLTGSIGTVWLFGARASALGFNQSLWIYSSVSFPTSCRTLGVAIVTGCARIGGIISPFIGQKLFSESETIALIVCAFLSSVCSLISMLCLKPTSENRESDTMRERN